MRFSLFALSILIGVMSVSGPARAGGGAATDSYTDIRRDTVLDLHGLADLYLQGNVTAPGSTTAQLRAFDTHLNVPGLGILRVTAAHAPERFGFRVDLAVGDLPDAYLRFDPAGVRYPEVSRALSYLEQAFVTASVPVGKGERRLTIDAGKFETPVGLEDNEALENWNYSRSFLYLLAEPSYHTGLRATYRLADELAVSAYWVNGWDTNVLEGNGMRAFAGAVTWNPSAQVEAVVDYMGGLERAPTNVSNATLAYRHELDGYVTYDLTNRVSLACTADYGHDDAQGGVAWGGIGGYLRYRAFDWLAGAVRGEHYEDPQGFTSGTKQRLAEITATIEARDRLGPLTLIGRLEYRRDQSDARAFEIDTPHPSPRQDTLGLSLLSAF